MVKITPIDAFRKGYGTPVGCRIVKITSFARDLLLGMKVRGLLLRCIQDVCVAHEHVWIVVPCESSIKEFYQSAGFGRCHCVLPWRETHLSDEWAQLCTRAHSVDHWGIHRRIAMFVNHEGCKPDVSQDTSPKHSIVTEARAKDTTFVPTNENQITIIANNQLCQENKASFVIQRQAHQRSAASRFLIPHAKKLPSMRIEERNRQLIVLDNTSPNRSGRQRSTDTVQASDLDSSVRDTFGHTAQDRKWLLEQYQTAESREQLQKKVQGLRDARKYMEDMSADKSGNSGKVSPLEVPGDLDGGVTVVDSTTNAKSAGVDAENRKQLGAQGPSGEWKKEDLPMDAASIGKRIRDRAMKELDRLSKK